MVVFESKQEAVDTVEKLTKAQNKQKDAMECRTTPILNRVKY